jgi:hypothetical protein
MQYESSWKFTVIAPSEDEITESYLEKLQLSLGGSLRRQKVIVDGIVNERNLYWISKKETFVDEINSDALSTLAIKIRNLIGESCVSVFFNVVLRHGRSTEFGGLVIEPTVVNALANIQACVDITIE